MRDIEAEASSNPVIKIRSNPLEPDFTQRSDLEGYQSPRTIRPQGSGSNIDSDLWQGLRPADITDPITVNTAAIADHESRISAIEGDYVPVSGGDFSGAVGVNDAFDVTIGSDITLQINASENWGLGIPSLTWAKGAIRGIGQQANGETYGVFFQGLVHPTGNNNWGMSYQLGAYPEANITSAGGQLLYYLVGVGGAGAKTITTFTGAYMTALLQAGTGAITNLRINQIANPTSSGAGVANVVGLYIDSLSAGTSSNTAIQTAGSVPSIFGGPVDAGSFKVGGVPGASGTINLGSVSTITVSGGIITGWA